MAPIQCNDGQYSLTGSTTCTSCLAGYQCANTSAAPELCPQGYQSVAMSTTCTPCPAGIGCPALHDPTVNHLCPQGIFKLLYVRSSVCVCMCVLCVCLWV